MKLEKNDVFDVHRNPEKIYQTSSKSPPKVNQKRFSFFFYTCEKGKLKSKEKNKRHILSEKRMLNL